MLVSDKDALERLGSPLNLINRLRSKGSNTMSLFTGNVKDKTEQPINNLNFSNPFQRQASPEAITVSSPTPVRISEDKEINPKLDDLVGDADNQVKLATAHNKALTLTTNALEMLQTKLDDIKPDKLPAVISAASKVVDQIQKQRHDANRNKNTRDVHYHFYTPTPRKIDEYEVIEVG